LAAQPQVRANPVRVFFLKKATVLLLSRIPSWSAAGNRSRWPVTGILTADLEDLPLTSGLIVASPPPEEQPHFGLGA
jgi:hypothetical protein